MASRRTALNLFDDEDPEASLDKAWGEYRSLTESRVEARTKGMGKSSTMGLSKGRSCGYGPETLSDLPPGEFILKMAGKRPWRGRVPPLPLQTSSRTTDHTECSTGYQSSSYTRGTSQGWTNSSASLGDRYFNTLIDDLAAEIDLLIRMGMYSKTELRAHCERLVTVFNNALE